MEVRLPDDAPSDSEYALEPRIDAPSAHNLKPSQLWPQPGVVSSVARAIRIPNLSSVPPHSQAPRTLLPSHPFPSSPPPTAQRPLPPSSTRYSASVQVDPDNTLPQTVRADFQSLLTEYDTVFDPQFPRIQWSRCWRIQGQSQHGSCRTSSAEGSPPPIRTG
ncbi:unnamed protein product [Pocillopora meandrina]|uniref:Uncharacterized protein n=1 Tax=Pocillopora meandrina TaxID=46732 RepID=A0AAU9XIQ4_9CNID|nr:unnamed protein product [Pocillopora meandrina]